MHCRYLSLRHHCNTNCRNMSLMITETSTTLSRPRSTRKFFLLPLFLSPRLTGEEASPLAPRMGVSCSSAHTRRSSSRMRAPCWASSRFRLLSFSSSSFFCSFRFSRRRKETVVASTSPPPASDATTRRGASPAECRTVRSLRCGPGSRRLPAARTPGSGGFCARRPSCAVSTLGYEWWDTVASTAATVCCSCRNHERRRRCLRRHAAPRSASGCPLDSAMTKLHFAQKETSEPVWLWWLWCGRGALHMCLAICASACNERVSASAPTPSAGLTSQKKTYACSFRGQRLQVQNITQPQGEKKIARLTHLTPTPSEEDGRNLFHLLGVERPGSGVK